MSQNQVLTNADTYQYRQLTSEESEFVEKIVSRDAFRYLPATRGTASTLLIKYERRGKKTQAYLISYRGYFGISELRVGVAIRGKDEKFDAPERGKLIALRNALRSEPVLTWRESNGVKPDFSSR
jgi:hypothetical protein